MFSKLMSFGSNFIINGSFNTICGIKIYANVQTKVQRISERFFSIPNLVNDTLSSGSLAMNQPSILKTIHLYRFEVKGQYQT